MADYYFPTVIQPFIPLAAMLPIERLFLSQFFSEEVEDGTAYYYSEDSAFDTISLAADDVRNALNTVKKDTSRLVQKLADELPDGVIGNEDLDLDVSSDLWSGVLQDIVRRSPDLDYITVTMAYTCSKMRPDGLGGLAMLITASTIRSGSTGTLLNRFYSEAAVNGEIGHGNS